MKHNYIKLVLCLLISCLSFQIATAQLNPLTIGTIPASDSIIIYHDVNINTSGLPALFNHVASRGTIAGTGFSGILTDDPSTVPVDSTLTDVNIPPVYISTSPQSVHMCNNNNGIIFSNVLTARDVNPNQTLTWTLTGSPSNGVITGVPASISSGTTNSQVSPAVNVIYSPNSGYIGPDQATITLSDGFDVATMVLNFTVDPPLGNNTISADQTVCTGTVPALLTGSPPTGGNGTYIYLWQMSTTSAVSGFATAPGTSNGQNYQPGAISVPTWFRRMVLNSGCIQNISTAAAISTTLTNTWTGIASSLWSNAANWSCGTVPTSTTDVAIPNVATQPFVDITNAAVNNLTINSGGNLQFSGTGSVLNVFGTITNNGIFDALSGTVAFRSASPQNMPGGPYSNIIINGTGPVTPDSNVSVASLLTLTAGNIQLGTKNLTIQNTGSAIAGGSAASHVITNGAGRLVQQGIGTGGRTGAIGFPIGSTAASYTPDTLTNTGTIDNFAAAVIDNVFPTYTGETPGGSAFTTNVVNKTWMMAEAIPGGSNATLKVTWNGSDEAAGFNRAACQESHYTSGAWNPFTGGAATGANPYSLSAANITSFSPFGVGSAGSPLVIPVAYITAGLQGDMQGIGTMRTDLQNYFGGNSGLLPTTDPYGLSQTYTQINNPSGPAGTVVDWVKVEVRNAATPATILQTRALLLKPNGTIVDSTGGVPKFNAQVVNVRVTVFHRNHLAILSNLISPIATSISYDFTTALGKASNAFSDPPQMVFVGGKWCMWAGDVNTVQDLFIDNVDFLITKTIFQQAPFDVYNKADLNMDGTVDNSDFLLQRLSFQQGVYSTISNY